MWHTSYDTLEFYRITKGNMFKRLISLIVIISFILTYVSPVYAKPVPLLAGDFSINQLPLPGTMVGESQPFSPLALKGLIVNPQKPLEFQFIIDTGSSNVIPVKAGIQYQEQLKQQANQLVKYFLAGLTIPEADLWVNLSPYEKNRMVPEALGQTDLGRDLLAQDYILKQLTASLIYPEKDLGKEFWSRVYAKAQQQFGTTNIPVNTFNKVWILPDQAQVFEHGSAAYVTKATLKVMLDEDYLALQKHSIPISQPKQLGLLGSQIVRAIILPEITKEINQGKNFALLRQIYQALILAKWYKETIQNGLLDAVYTNKNKVIGVNLNDPSVKEQIYNRYLQAYKKGAFNYIKEDSTSNGQVVPRKYFSGGTSMAMSVRIDGKLADIKSPDGAMVAININLKMPETEKKVKANEAMNVKEADLPWKDSFAYKRNIHAGTDDEEIESFLNKMNIAVKIDPLNFKGTIALMGAGGHIDQTVITANKYKNARIVVLDFVPAYVQSEYEEIKKKYPALLSRMSFVVADAKNLNNNVFAYQDPLGIVQNKKIVDEKFDMVLFQGVLELYDGWYVGYRPGQGEEPPPNTTSYHNKVDQQAILFETKRILKKGGILGAFSIDGSLEGADYLIDEKILGFESMPSSSHVKVYKRLNDTAMTGMGREESRDSAMTAAEELKDYFSRAAPLFEAETADWFNDLINSLGPDEQLLLQNQLLSYASLNAKNVETLFDGDQFADAPSQAHHILTQMLILRMNNGKAVVLYRGHKITMDQLKVMKIAWLHVIQFNDKSSIWIPVDAAMRASVSRNREGFGFNGGSLSAQEQVFEQKLVKLLIPLNGGRFTNDEMNNLIQRLVRIKRGALGLRKQFFSEEDINCIINFNADNFDGSSFLNKIYQEKSKYLVKKDGQKLFFSKEQVNRLLFQKLIPLELVEYFLTLGLTKSQALNMVIIHANPKVLWENEMKPNRDKLIAKGLLPYQAMEIVLKWKNPIDKWDKELKPVIEDLERSGVKNSYAYRIATGWENPLDTWRHVLRLVKEELVISGVPEQKALQLALGWKDPVKKWEKEIKPAIEKLEKRGLSKQDSLRIAIARKNPVSKWDNDLKPIVDKLVQEGVPLHHAITIVISYKDPLKEWRERLKPNLDKLLEDEVPSNFAFYYLTKYKQPFNFWQKELKPVKESLVNSGLNTSQAFKLIQGYGQQASKIWKEKIEKNVKDLIAFGVPAISAFEIAVSYRNPVEEWKQSLQAIQNQLVQDGLPSGYTYNLLAKNNPLEKWNVEIKPTANLLMNKLPISKGKIYELLINNSKGSVKDKLVKEYKIPAIDADQLLIKLSEEDDPKDEAMSSTDLLANKGGIDLNKIKVKRTCKMIIVHFDQAQLNELEQSYFKGFTPVITGFKYIQSPFPLLGINAPTSKTEILAKV